MIAWRICRRPRASATSLLPLEISHRLISTAVPQNATLSPRWLTDIKERIGKCLMFGMSSELIDESGQVLEEIARDWRDLVASSEGFLTTEDRAGLSRQAVVWGEMDSMGHVNNVQYVRYAESGRCNWIRNFGKYFDIANKSQWDEMLSSRNIGLILKSITIDYKFPMTWPDRISVFHKLRSKPTESTGSLLLDVMILSEVRQRPAARCVEEVVVYDYQKGKKTTLPPFMLDQLSRTYELQEASKMKNSARVQNILERVEWLEKQSWDRPDAKEDFGKSKR